MPRGTSDMPEHKRTRYVYIFVFFIITTHSKSNVKSLKHEITANVSNSVILPGRVVFPLDI